MTLLFFNFGLVIVPAQDGAFRGGKPETVAEVDASSGSFAALRFVQDDAFVFCGWGCGEGELTSKYRSFDCAALRSG
jgi:hypothetical protein